MNILLANPKSGNVFKTFGFIFPPLGLLYVAASAEKEGYRVAIEDFCVSGKSPGKVDFGKFNVVGITSDTRRFQGALEIAKKAKAAGCAVVMGGTHPPFVDEEILKEGYVDFVVRGEGEITFPSLLEAIENSGELKEVKGISFLNNAKLVRTLRREPIKDIDSLPLPARHLVDMEVYKKAGYKYGGKRSIAVMASSRGCPHECNFCLTPELYGRSWRGRSAGSVVSEIEELYYKYGYRAVAFSDDNFTISPRRVKEICEMLIEKNLDLWWWCLSSPGTLLKNEDMVRFMAKAGAKTVYIGVESASQKTLDDYKKGTKEDTPFKAVNLLKNNGIEVFASYILGGQNDGVRDILRTIKLAKTLDTGVAQFTILTPYPGTPLYADLKSSLRHQTWRLYDGLHLVFRHKKIPFLLMELLLIWAYVSFYARGWRAIKGFIKVFTKNSPILRFSSRSKS